MARICIMCGKKLGVLNEGISINETMELCAKCHSGINMKYIVPMNKATNIDAVNDRFKEAMSNIEKDEYSGELLQILKDFIISQRDKNLKRFTDKKNEQEEQERIQRERQQIIDQLNEFKRNFKVTTGYNFEGYRIEEYRKVVSGSVALGTGFLSEFNASISDLFGAKSDTFADKLETAKDAAYDKMIIKAMSTGANAIIGVDFDYITFENNMIGVVANGTAVVIEKVEGGKYNG